MVCLSFSCRQASIADEWFIWEELRGGETANSLEVNDDNKLIMASFSACFQVETECQPFPYKVALRVGVRVGVRVGFDRPFLSLPRRGSFRALADADGGRRPIFASWRSCALCKLKLSDLISPFPECSSSQ